MFTFFTGDLLPIIVVMLLGYVSGKRQAFDEEQARALNKLVLNYALPAALFVSIARANRDMIFADSRLTLISLVVIVGCFLFSWFSCYKFFKRTRAEAAVCALIAGSPTVGFLGFAVLDPHLRCLGFNRAGGRHHLDYCERDYNSSRVVFTQPC